jgi:hypothetical protein
MAVLDVNEGFKSVGDKITTTKKYKKIKEDSDTLKKKKGDTFEKKSSDLKKQLSEVNKETKKFLKDQKSQIDNLLDLKFLSTGSGSSTKKYLKKTFVKSIEELKPKILELLIAEFISAIGCSQDQEFTNQTLYIRVKPLDLQNILKEDPQGDVGKLLYEQTDIQYGNFPFSMNRELYNRIQNINQPFSVPAGGSPYKGKSNQDLFDITYVETYNDPISGQVIQGNFYKIDLKNRVTGVNKITEFIKDYFASISIIDLKNLFSNLMNQLSGAISIKKGEGKLDLGDLQKILLILQRVLGLCVDKTEEIDVSGTAKVSDSDTLDDSFFEFTEVDLRIIDQKISDIKLGVVEFEECDTVKLPVNTDDILSALNNLNFIDNSNNNNNIDDAADLTDVLTNNPGWFPLEINIDLSFLKEFPKALILTLLSPKVLLPLYIMLKAVGDNADLAINSFMDFAKKFKSLIFKLTSKIGSLFTKILFEIIKKDIKNLIKSVIGDIKNEKIRNRLEAIRSLTEVLVTLAKVIKDFRECKSVIDELLALLKIAGRGFGNKIPYPLLLASEFLDGYSSSRALLNVVEEFEKLGLPTGLMPDGSPNLMLISFKALLDGQEKEDRQNGGLQVAVKPMAVSPINLTQGLTIFGTKT